MICKRLPRQRRLCGVFGREWRGPREYCSEFWASYCHTKRRNNGEEHEDSPLKLVPMRKILFHRMRGVAADHRVENGPTLPAVGAPYESRHLKCPKCHPNQAR